VKILLLLDYLIFVKIFVKIRFAFLCFKKVKIFSQSRSVAVAMDEIAIGLQFAMAKEAKDAIAPLLQQSSWKTLRGRTVQLQTSVEIEFAIK
jgi:phosphoglycerate dehydrogenase-like enzyme